MNENDQDIETETPAAEAEVPAPELETIKTVEAWAEELGSPKWKFAGARMLHAWPIGRELTRADYEAALDAAANVVCR